MAKAETTVGGGNRVSAPKHTSGKHKLHRTVIDHADNGGHMVRHEFRTEGKHQYEGGGKPDENIAVGSNAQLKKHMSKMFPVGGAASGDTGGKDSDE